MITKETNTARSPTLSSLNLALVAGPIVDGPTNTTDPILAVIITSLPGKRLAIYTYAGWQDSTPLCPGS